MTKKIGFIGNCQLGTLSALYKRLLGDNAETEVFYIPSYQGADDSQKALIASADIVVRQILDFDQKIGELQTEAVSYLFPHVSGAFLWPYGGQAHPQNKSFPYFDANGPYPSEMGDSFLNRLIADNIDPDTAVARYMETDVAAVKRLDRLREIVLDKQRARDKVGGYGFADYIDAHFRSESLFRSPSHPEIPLTMMMAAELFEKLGMDRAVVIQAAEAPPIGLFPISATPIHPSVVAKFNLAYIGEDHRYRYFDEGSFTFAEYAGRYMRFEWSPKLAEGLHWFRSGELDKALEALELGVVEAPYSAIGRFVLSDLLVKKNRLAEGVQRAREAAQLEPSNKHFQQRFDYFNSLRSRSAQGDGARIARPASPTQASVTRAAAAETSGMAAMSAPAAPDEDEVLDAELEIVFGRDGNATAFQGEGWSAPEPNYTWTIAQRATLRVPRTSVPGGLALSFSATPYAPKQRPYQRFAVMVNDVRLAELFLESPTTLSLWIPEDVVAKIGDALTIAFQIPDAAKPADFDPAATDTRNLGMAFTRMAIKAIGRNP